MPFQLLHELWTYFGLKVTAIVFDVQLSIWQPRSCSTDGVKNVLFISLFIKFNPLFFQKQVRSWGLPKGVRMWRGGSGACSPGKLLKYKFGISVRHYRTSKGVCSNPSNPPPTRLKKMNKKWKNGRNKTLLDCLKNQYNKNETFIFK